MSRPGHAPRAAEGEIPLSGLAVIRARALGRWANTGEEIDTFALAQALALSDAIRMEMTTEDAEAWVSRERIAEGLLGLRDLLESTTKPLAYNETAFLRDCLTMYAARAIVAGESPDELLTRYRVRLVPQPAEGVTP